MRPQIVNILVVILSLFNALSSHAQGTSKTPPAPQRTMPPIQLPIDTGLYILLALGVIYGCYVTLKKYTAKNKAH